MESWEPYNYYTTNSTEWVILMNLSTQEWGVGYLPPGIIAINTTFNDSFHFPNNSIIIQNVAQAEWGSYDIEKVIFGATSGVAILWGLIWLWLNRKVLLAPRAGSTIPKSGGTTTSNNDTTSARHRSPVSTVPSSMQLTSLDDDEFITDSTFRQCLRNYYYEPGTNELELYEKDPVRDCVYIADIEEVTELLRKMYGFDLELWGQQNALYVTDAERDQFRVKSDAALAEVRSVVTNLHAQQSAIGWREDEMEHLEAIVNILQRNLPGPRYGDRR